MSEDTASKKCVVSLYVIFTVFEVDGNSFICCLFVNIRLLTNLDSIGILLLMSFLYIYSKMLIKQVLPKVI